MVSLALSYALSILNQTGDDTATEEGRETPQETTPPSRRRRHRRACPKSFQISEGKEKTRRACKQRREEVQEVSKKRESRRYQITNAGGRHRHRRKQETPRAENTRQTHHKPQIRSKSNQAEICPPSSISLYMEGIRSRAEI